MENVDEEPIDEDDVPENTNVNKFESFSDAVTDYIDNMTEFYHNITMPAADPEPAPEEYPERDRDIISGQQFLVAGDIAYGIGLSEYYLGNKISAEDWLETAVEHYMDGSTFMFETPFYAEDNIDIYGLDHPNIGGHCEIVPTSDGIIRHGVVEPTENNVGYKPEIGTPDHKVDVLYRALAISMMIDDTETAEECAERIDKTYLTSVDSGDENTIHIWLTAGFKRGIAGLVIGNKELIDKTSVALHNAGGAGKLTPELDLQLQIAEGFSSKNDTLIRNGIELMIHKHVAKNTQPPIHIPSRLCCLEATLITLVARKYGYDVRDGNEEIITYYHDKKNQT